MKKKTSYDENKWDKMRLYPTGFSVVEPLVHYRFIVYNKI